MIRTTVIIVATLAFTKPGQSDTMNLSTETGDTSSDLNAESKGRIVGGWECNIENYPWLASLQKGGRHFCGGSLISHWIVLTAAHCIQTKWISNMLVRLGSKHWNKGGQLLQVASFKIHEEYSIIDGIPVNDLALIKLNKVVIFSNKLKPIKLMDQTNIEDINADIMSAGWGATEEGGGPSQLLRCIEVFIVDNDECGEAYGTIPPGQICAKNYEEDTCQGDSGGPLWIDNHQIGIVSYGHGCARREFPGVYTQIAYHHYWIEESLTTTNHSEVEGFTKASIFRSNSPSSFGTFTSVLLFICQIIFMITKLIIL